MLVTGGGGFLGQYVVEQLVAAGAEVTSFSRRHYPPLDALAVRQMQGDLRDADAVHQACAGIESIFHVAAVAGIWGSWGHYHGINTLGTQNIIAAAKSQGVQRLVYSSSPSVTFDRRDQVNVDESAPYPSNWLCHYPHTKALAEQAVLAAHSDGLRTCALRPHLIWGPRDQHLIPRLIQRARSGKLMRVGDGSNLVDMIYVENAATAHLLAHQSLATDGAAGGKAYFISQGDPINCWDWINDLLALVELPPITKSVSFSLAWRVGSIVETLHWLFRRRGEPRMTRFLAAQLAKSHYFNMEAAQRDFQYEPIVSTCEGMRRLGLWLKENGS